MKNFSAVVHPLTKLFLTLLLTVCALGLHAQAKLSVQGLLKKSDGTSLPDGNYDLTFRFYDAENGGASLEAVTVNTEVNGGVYSAVLSGFTVLDFAVPYFASVSVNGGTELLPRIALTAAPYAISLQGQNNKFPSIGLVKADAIDVAGNLNANTFGPVNTSSVSASGAVNAGSVSASGQANAKNMVVEGGAPAAGISGKGYSFGTGGDADGGLFSLGDNNVCLYANQTKKIELSNVSIQLLGDVNSTGKVVSAGGFSFSNDGSYDSGMFNNGDGTCILRTNGVDRFITNNTVTQIGSNGDVQLFGNSAGSSTSLFVGGAIVMDVGTVNTNLGQYYMTNMKPKTGGGTFRNIQINTANWVVQYDNSSRRYKYNIRPLEDDFSLILKSQPRIYTRQPEDTFTELGYIAEEMDSIGLQHLVQRDKNGIVDGFDYDKMILYAVEVLKIQHADIEKLKAEVAALTAEKNALGAENAGLRADIQKQQTDFGKQLDGISRRLRSLETAAGNR